MYCVMCWKEKSTGSLKDILFGEDPLCEDCRKLWQRKQLHFQLDGIDVEAPFLYEEAFSKCLIQFKECGDEALKDIFLYPIRKEFQKKYKRYTLCLMPSSSSKEKERGFSHLQKMFEPMNMPMISPFIKMEDHTQKFLSQSERFRMVHGIQLKNDIVVPKKILLCDDTITTGSTLRGALSTLNKQNHDIKIFCVSANKSWAKEKQESPVSRIGSILHKIRMS